MNILKNIIQKVPKHLWILLAIFSVGIFLRTYHFRDWLYFYPDQARDVMITRDVLNGSEPVPNMGAIAASTNFKIGPMYYYFQIVSGKIFGVAPETMAYPDLFFSILTIPLFYFFLKRYFSQGISLSLTGLFSVSFFAIKYSRFAWNSNPTPFFVLLFLMSLLEFLDNKEKTSWKWMAGAGIALGVGIQLHTTLFVLLPPIALLVFVYLIIKDRNIWKNGICVLLIALALNAVPLIHEISTNFHNTRILYNVSTEGSQHKSTFLDSLKMNTLCHIQANSYIVSSLGDKEDCNFLNILRRQVWSIDMDKKPLEEILLSIIFSVLGYAALVCYFFLEKESRKKNFLGLILLFIFLSYLIFFTVADSLLLRYFINLIFVPFLFLGFFIKLLQKCYRIIFWPITVFLFLFLALTNVSTLTSEAKTHFAKDRSDPMYVVLGEIEPMRDYMISQSGSHREAYFYAEGKYMQNYFKPMFYISSEKNFIILRAKSPDEAPAGELLFFIGASSEYDNSGYLNGRMIVNYKNFGQIGVYELEN